MVADRSDEDRQKRVVCAVVARRTAAGRWRIAFEICREPSTYHEQLSLCFLDMTPTTPAAYQTFSSLTTHNRIVAGKV